MTLASPHCTDGRKRRNRLITRSCQDVKNGIDHIEIVSAENQHLRLHFFAGRGIDELGSTNIQIRGRRPKPLTVKATDRPAMEESDEDLDCPIDLSNSLDVFVDGLRESETYTLELVKIEDGCRTHETPADFDPRHAKVQFTWRRTPRTDVDFQPVEIPASAVRADAEVDYLARDYTSFRRLLLDRLSQIMPDWHERNAADVGITLVELLAWVGDRLSYQQDAVGTEAYLGTARQRISVRRHARLVDYRMHEGCNARVLMHISVNENRSSEPFELCTKGLKFCTTPAAEFRSLANPETRLIETIPEHQQERFFNSVQVFQPVPQPPRPVLLTTDDLICVKGIVTRLATEGPSQPGEQQTGIQRVYAELRPGIRDRIQRLHDNGEYVISELVEQELVTEFNRLISEERLHDDPADGAMSLQSLALAACHAEDTDFARRNRELLDEVFRGEISPMRSKAVLSAAHNRILFYTWDEDECWLPAGATSATLLDQSVASGEKTGTATDTCPNEDHHHNNEQSRPLSLAAGDILVFEEVKGPRTGNEVDANPAHRHAVRLTRVCRETDDVPQPPVNIVEVEWAQDDALPFSMCLSSTTSESECCPVTNVSIARGNILVADHGRTVTEPSFTNEPGVADDFVVRGTVRQIDCGDDVDLPARVIDAEPFSLVLGQSGLTFSQPLERVPASRLMVQDVHATRPAIDLTGVPGNPDGSPKDEMLARDVSVGNLGPRSMSALSELLPPELARWLDEIADRQAALCAPAPQPACERDPQDSVPEHRLIKCLVALLRQATRWEPQPDLIDSRGIDRHFVVEMDNLRRAHLRFGDNRLGRRPGAGTRFFAKYRVGNGASGNVGAESLRFAILKNGAAETAIKCVRNPMAAAGGRDPQSIREVKLLAPHAYRENQPRAITADDYTRIVRHEFAGEIQDARAVLARVAAGYAVTVAIDPFDSVRHTDQLQEQVREALHRVRGIGHSVHVTLADYVPLDIQLTVAVNPAWQKSHVRRDLSELFSNRRLPDGRLGLFHPDRVTFGNDIYASQLTLAAQEVSGVDGVALTRLQRMGDPDPEVPSVLRIDPLQIARLDNDSNQSNGRIVLCLEDGK